MKLLSVNELAALVTKRPVSLFSADLEQLDPVMEAATAGRRILVIGGAGSIGSATIRQLASRSLAALHVVDQNENGLTEIVRDLRSSTRPMAARELRTFPLDFGSSVMRRLLRENPPYDIVLNFAAIKHVRSEKDTLSLLQMFDTNIVKAARLLEWLAETGHTGRYFSVSTDKAANPVNFMGASKRVMEHVTFAGEFDHGALGVITSARFANVAFSDGSLLHGFLQRLQKAQPLAVPAATRRYFVSPEESGQLCAIAALAGENRAIVIPRLDPSTDLQLLDDVAATVVRAHGFEPALYGDEQEARRSVQADVARGRYPLLVTALDTSGEKPYEEFVGRDETAVDIGWPGLCAVRYEPAPGIEVRALVDRFAALIANSALPVSKNELARNIGRLVPQFAHVETGRSLDGRM